jgi:hypothetical protein
MDNFILLHSLITVIIFLSFLSDGTGWRGVVLNVFSGLAIKSHCCLANELAQCFIIQLTQLINNPQSVRRKRKPEPRQVDKSHSPLYFSLHKHIVSGNITIRSFPIFSNIWERKKKDILNVTNFPAYVHYLHPFSIFPRKHSSWLPNTMLYNMFLIIQKLDVMGQTSVHLHPFHLVASHFISNPITIFISYCPLIGFKWTTQEPRYLLYTNQTIKWRLVWLHEWL